MFVHKGDTMHSLSNVNVVILTVHHNLTKTRFQYGFQLLSFLYKGLVYKATCQRRLKKT